LFAIMILMSEATRLKFFQFKSATKLGV